MAIPVQLNEATATKRRVYFQLVDATDGITPETGEAAGQPQISTNGAAFTDTGIGTLTHAGNGRYYADVTQAAVNGTEGDRIETRYKSANTAEGVGDTLTIVTHDPYNIAGANAGLRTITLQVKDATPAAVLGATVDVFDSSNTSFIRRLEDSNLDGDITAYLDDGTYKLRAVAPFWTQDTQPQTLTVTADASVTISGVLWSVPAPSSADMCVIYGDLKDIIGTATEGATISIEPDYRTTAQGNVLTTPKRTADSDATGYFSIEAIRGASVIVWLQAAGWNGIALTVPDAASQDLATWTS